MLVPDIDWVKIPAGEFIYGERGETLRLDTYSIAHYPVTNVQYQTFIDDGGYEDARCWEDLRITKPAEQDWPQDNRPRTSVNWYEAMAFCRWLSNALGYEIRLPTEHEWEKAARGTQGLEYPWGKGYQVSFANVDEKKQKTGSSYLQQTTAVGLYPHGASADKVEDMAGTVWEWCQNKYDNPEQLKPDTGGDNRVLRGAPGSSIQAMRARPTAAGAFPSTEATTGVFECCVFPHSLNTETLITESFTLSGRSRAERRTVRTIIDSAGCPSLLQIGACDSPILGLS